jgi:hypothetical protein
MAIGQIVVQAGLADLVTGRCRYRTVAAFSR